MHVRGVCANGARRERMKERGRGKSREEMNKRARMHVHALACTHARRRSAYSAAKTGVRKVTNGEQRRESVGSPTWLTNGQSALYHRWISSWFPARYTAFAFTHERDGREKETERGKKAGECTREQRKSYEFAKEEERNASDGRRKKEEERRVCIASRLLPPYLGRQRGEGERQKEGHNMPNERAPWTSRCDLAKERRAWKEGASPSQGERVREKEEGEFLGYAASQREGKRQTWRTRASLKLGAIGESHFCEDTPDGLHRRRFLRSSCWRTATGSASDSRNSAAFESSERQTEKNRQKEGERDRKRERNPHTQSSPIRGSSGSQSASWGARKPAAENKRRCQARRGPISSQKSSKDSVFSHPVHFVSRVCSPWPTRDLIHVVSGIQPRVTRGVVPPRIYHRTLSAPIQNQSNPRNFSDLSPVPRTFSLPLVVQPLCDHRRSPSRVVSASKSLST